MIILKAIMLIITMFLSIANNYRKEPNDYQLIVNLVLLMYFIVILFG